MAFGIDGDRAIHLRPVDGHPLATDPHIGLEIGRGVELFGEDAIGRCGYETCLFGVLRAGADALRVVDQQRQQFAGRRRDLDAGIRWLVFAAADLDLLDDVVGATLGVSVSPEAAERAHYEGTRALDACEGSQPAERDAYLEAYVGSLGVHE